MAKSYEGIQPVPFGGYQLVERLAMGGMAEVYLARPDGQERLVALKRILPSIASDEEFIAMFIDEAKIAGQLNHPSIAQILDLGKINASYFISMEYVSGHDLRALWDRTRDNGKDGKTTMPIGLACFVVKKICDGLDYAHRRRDAKGRPLGIIHRDVSPQNVLISYDGDLKIIDFGIAKAANRIVRTQTGILKGKFAYMAPEQARGEPTDHRADIFAIGVILYELLTGERAFKADTDFVLLEKVRRVDVLPARQLRPDIPKDLERILAKALAKEAADRYAWASSLGSDLDRFMSDQAFSSSKEELAAFVQRTFRAEHDEEKRRLAAYRALFDDGEMSAATMVRGKRPSLDPATGQSDDGTIESQESAGGFEDQATEAVAPRHSTSQATTGADAAPSLLASLREQASSVSKSASSSARVADPPGHSDDVDDDEIDASAEASAIGAALPEEHGATGPMARHSTDSEPPPPLSAPSGASARPALVRAVDETQLDPLTPRAAPPVRTGPVSRDEVPRKSRMVSARPEVSSPRLADNDGAGETSRIPVSAPGPSGEPSEPSRSSNRTDLVERGARARGVGERSHADRSAPLPAPPVVPTGPVLIAAALGAVIGAGVVAIGWLASGGSPPPVVFVATPRQAEVRRGDEVLCSQTPCAVALAVGRHDVRIRAPGAEEIARTVEVRPEGAPPVEVVLVRMRDDVRVETDPPNAHVQLDGKPLPGQTPLTLPPLAAGAAVRLKLTHDGFDPLEVTRNVDDESVWRYELPTSTTRWRITVTPPDALVEGASRGKDGVITVKAEKKSAHVVFTRPGCDQQPLTVYPTGRRDAEQKVTMTCRKLSAGLAVKYSGRRPQVNIDGVDVARDASLNPYPLPPGTFTVTLRGNRGKTEAHTVELREGETLTITSTLK
ncbi:MAG: protein kinase [Deltaproteobacteria bacterium]|nr:protein kinase [Deltaproteobacteria bacterium]